MAGQRNLQSQVAGVVVKEGRIEGVILPVPLLVLDLVGWATESAQAYRRASLDEDWSDEEREGYQDQALKLESWIAARRFANEIPTSVNMFLAARSAFMPHTIVTVDELAEYVASILSGTETTPVNEIDDPQFTLNVDKGEFWVSHAPGLRAVRSHAGPSVRIHPVSVMELIEIIATLKII